MISNESTQVGLSIGILAAASQLGERVVADLREIERHVAEATTRVHAITGDVELTNSGKIARRAAAISDARERIAPWRKKVAELQSRVTRERDEALKPFLKTDVNMLNELRARELRDRLMGIYGAGVTVDLVQSDARYLEAIASDERELAMAMERAPFRMVSERAVEQGRQLLLQRVPEADAIREVEVVRDAYEYVLNVAEQELESLARVDA